MNIKKQLQKYTVLSIAVLSSIPALAVQDVYKYQNKEGVTEFTDQVKGDKKPENHIQIPKRTVEQEAQSKEKLDDIMKKDKELDKKLANERKLENERLRREEQARMDRNQYNSESDNSDRDNDRNDGWYYSRPIRPVRPINPDRPHRPVHPVHPIHPDRPNRPGKPKPVSRPAGRL